MFPHRATSCRAGGADLALLPAAGARLLPSSKPGRHQGGETKLRQRSEMMNGDVTVKIGKTRIVARLDWEMA
jgi:hypothetical protein